MGVGQLVAAYQAGLEVLDRHRRADNDRAAPRVLGVDDDGTIDRVFKRSDARFEHHLLLAYVVVFVVVRALTVGARLAQPQLDVLARVLAEPLERGDHASDLTLTLLGASAALQIVAVALFVSQLWPRIYGRGKLGKPAGRGASSNV